VTLKLAAAAQTCRSKFSPKDQRVTCDALFDFENFARANINQKLGVARAFSFRVISNGGGKFYQPFG
jgi:hypothetical protein